MENGKLLTILMVLLLISSLCTVGLVYSNKDKKVEVNVNNSEVMGALAAQNEKLEAMMPVASNDTVDVVSGDFVLTKSEFEDEQTDAMALKLAIESVMSRDCKKAIFEALVDAGEDIENYKDITEILIKETDVSGNDVEFEVKVYYLIDGDEEETGKALLDDFEVTVDGLDFDDDFVDAEADDSYMDTLTVAKVYE